MNFLNEIKQIAREAGTIIMEVYEAAEGIVYDKKDDDSPLTKADSLANAHICKGLEALATKYPIISEENKAIPYDDRKSYDRFWMVDPLDGTKEFIKRNGEFTVNIALIEKGTPIFGVVYAPALDEMYWAEKGAGAFCEKDGSSEKIKAPKYSPEDKGLGIVCSRSHLNRETEEFIKDYTEPNLVSKGSSLKFLMLASGKAHVYPRIAPTMEWDTAAAQVILEESGGSVVQFETGAPLSYNKENLLNPYFVAYAQRAKVGA
ncbi:MAG: 3'(2'),5'-bisphosphate nucleotidase CysQ [Saprospiraceae bacterium]|nr:3'(2'),5'-bisphosphate nucleotidase CysQ [Saprospiraceae bacterium]